MPKSLCLNTLKLSITPSAFTVTAIIFCRMTLKNYTSYLLTLTADLSADTNWSVYFGFFLTEEHSPSFLLHFLLNTNYYIAVFIYKYLGLFVQTYGNYLFCA